jgi:hypothetical protein
MRSQLPRSPRASGKWKRLDMRVGSNVYWQTGYRGVIGDAAKIQAQRVRKQKTDRQDAR